MIVRPSWSNYIATDLDKYNKITTILRPEDALDIRELIIEWPAGNAYSTLKDALIELQTVTNK